MESESSDGVYDLVGKTVAFGMDRGFGFVGSLPAFFHLKSIIGDLSVHVTFEYQTTFDPTTVSAELFRIDPEYKKGTDLHGFRPVSKIKETFPSGGAGLRSALDRVEELTSRGPKGLALILTMKDA